MKTRDIPAQTLRRLPGYYNYLKGLQQQGETQISAPAIARALGYHEVQVRKDLATVSEIPGRPRTGFVLEPLLFNIGDALGFHNQAKAVLLGVGQLGRALLGYQGFRASGVHIVAAFDTQPELHGSIIDGREVHPLEELPALCRQMDVCIGILAVPADVAQEVCDLLLAAGVRGIWNFAMVHLHTPEHVVVQNENLATNLALLSRTVAQQEEGKA